jgi:ubiquinone/menaquinone biosynthesis C-methylase UbiE
MNIDEYRKLAETEDRMWYFHALNRRMLLALRSWNTKQARVLDAGCGTGGLIRTLKQTSPSWSITGIDVLPVACAYARETTQAEMVEGSLTDLPFAANTFDIVTCTDVISQVKDGDLALKEIARVLRPNGMLVLNVAAYQWMWSYHDDTCETKHRYRKSELERIVRSCGFLPLQATYANIFISPFNIARPKIFPPNHPTSDVRTYPEIIDLVFRVVTRIEHAWIKSGCSFPTGWSVLMAAGKP